MSGQYGHSLEENISSEHSTQRSFRAWSLFEAGSRSEKVSSSKLQSDFILKVHMKRQQVTRRFPQRKPPTDKKQRHAQKHSRLIKSIYRHPIKAVDFTASSYTEK